MRTNEQKSTARVDLVILVHGLAGNSYWMVALAHRLRRQGYRCVYWTYPSFRKTIAFHSEKFRSYLLNDLANENRVHLIGHSMGTIIIRASLAAGCPNNLGRVVLLAPPNGGTPTAFRVNRTFPSWFPTVADLSNGRDSFVNSLPPWNGHDLGVLAAKYDILVPLESTFLVNQTDHAIVPTTHIGLAFSRSAADMTIRFLREGRFQSPAASDDAETQVAAESDVATLVQSGTHEQTH